MVSSNRTKTKNRLRFSKMRKITMQEVECHNTPDDCWVVLNGKVYDLSIFQKEHPGGSKTITDNAGKDVSNLFNSVHPKDIIQRLLPLKPVLAFSTKARSTLKSMSLRLREKLPPEVHNKNLRQLQPMLNRFNRGKSRQLTPC